MNIPDSRDTARRHPLARFDARPTRGRGASGRTGRLAVVPLTQTGLAADVTDHLDLVDGLLTEVLADLRHLWTTKLDGAAVADVLGDSDLPDLLDELIRSGGQADPAGDGLPRLAQRPAAGPAASVTPRSSGSGAALELLHLFALVHDDVMDESASRRGLPTVHTRADQLHRAAAARGSSGRFGESIAILLGDLAHAEADHLAADLPPEMRKVWRLLVIELVYGQRRDLTGSAAGRRDLRERAGDRPAQVGRLHRRAAAGAGRGRGPGAGGGGGAAGPLRPRGRRGLRPARRPAGRLGGSAPDRQAGRGRPGLRQADGDHLPGPGPAAAVRLGRRWAGSDRRRSVRRTSSCCRRRWPAPASSPRSRS